MKNVDVEVKILTGGSARGVEREHGLNGHVHRRNIKRLKHDLYKGDFILFISIIITP